MQDIGPIDDLQRVAHIMVGNEDADAAILEVRDEVADVADRDRIDPGKRLIEQNEVRLGRQRPRAARRPTAPSPTRAANG
jgi:hypothetical protein